MKVIFRKKGTRKEKEIYAFFPEATCQRGNIMSYQHIGQHGEASLEFYNETKPAKKDEYAELYAELKGIYGKLEVKERIYMPYLERAWKRGEMKNDR